MVRSMGKNSKAGKRKNSQKVIHNVTEEAKQVSRELETNFNRRMMPVAVTEAFIVLLNIGCIVLHDDFKFGKQRLTKWVNRVLDTWECVPDYVTMDELSDEVIRMTGCRYALNTDEVTKLKESSMRGIAKEVHLQDAAKEYWEARKSQGWASTVNRRGKEVL